jgi:hypothetical protein
MLESNSDVVLYLRMHVLQALKFAGFPDREWDHVFKDLTILFDLEP